MYSKGEIISSLEELIEEIKEIAGGDVLRNDDDIIYMEEKLNKINTPINWCNLSYLNTKEAADEIGRFIKTKKKKLLKISEKIINNYGENPIIIKMEDTKLHHGNKYYYDEDERILEQKRGKYFLFDEIKKLFNYLLLSNL